MSIPFFHFQCTVFTLNSQPLVFMLCCFDIFEYRDIRSHAEGKYVWMAYIFIQPRGTREKTKHDKKCSTLWSPSPISAFSCENFSHSLLFSIYLKKYRVICMQNDYRHFFLPLLNLFSCTHLSLNVTVTHFVLFPFSVLLTILPLISQKSERKMIWPISFIFIPQKHSTARRSTAFFILIQSFSRIFFSFGLCFSLNWRVNRFSQPVECSAIYNIHTCQIADKYKSIIVYLRSMRVCWLSWI